MGQLRLPEGAEASFRVETEDAFGRTFSINVYGDGRSGWFVSSLRSGGLVRDSGVKRLAKGEWPTLLHHIERCGFWSLPEDGSHLDDPNWEVMDGEWLTVAGRIENRYHRIRRFVWRENGLEAVLSFGRRVSGYFTRHPVSGLWLSQPL